MKVEQVYKSYFFLPFFLQYIVQRKPYLLKTQVLRCFNGRILRSKRSRFLFPAAFVHSVVHVQRMQILICRFLLLSICSRHDNQFYLPRYM